MTVTQSYIGGESVASRDEYDNIDPATGRTIGAVARGGIDEIDRAVATARTACSGWQATTPAERAKVLARFADLIEREQERLALTESEDTGKPLSQARTDAQVASRYFRFYGHAIDTYYGHTIPLSTDLHVYTRREPLGVTGHILAWNYPMQLLSRRRTGDCDWQLHGRQAGRRDTAYRSGFREARHRGRAAARRIQRRDRNRIGGRCRVVRASGRRPYRVRRLHGCRRGGRARRSSASGTHDSGARWQVRADGLSRCRPTPSDRVHREGDPAERRPNLLGGFPPASTRVDSRHAARSRHAPLPKGDGRSRC